MDRRHRNLYRVESVHVLSSGEQIAWVLTPAGGYVVGSIPDATRDTAVDAGILAHADSLDEAEAWYHRNYRA